MTLSTLRVDEFAKMKYGKMPKREILSDSGYPVYSGYRITGYAKEYLYSEPKLIVVARGVGGTGDVKISPPNSWITNLSIVLELDESKVDKRYLLYKLSREPLKEKLNTGAAQAQITIENLSSYKIRIPEISTQKSIVEVISQYDDLIENNKRRIELLEESARQLYKEWFVRFRFPGHEHVKIIDGVPEGWSKGRVSDLGEVITGKTPSTKREENYGGDVPFIKTPDMHGNSIVISTGQYLTERGSNTQPKKLIPANSIMISCIGTIGVTSLNAYPSHTNQQINSVIPRVEEYRYFAFFAIEALKYRMEAMGGGATMANVNKAKFSGLPILVPPYKLLESFHQSVSSLFSQILMLSMSSAKLAEARDLLLPKLMNGEISL